MLLLLFRTDSIVAIRGLLLTARILNGNVIRDQIYGELAGEIASLAAAGIRPGLAAVRVGDNPASKLYVNSKIAACEKLGLSSFLITPSASITTAELLAVVDELNGRDDVDGILVQMPLPSQIDSKKILDAVDPAKDVDGFHPVNVGRLVAGQPTLVACTPAGVMEILRRSNIKIEGANAVVIGRSDIVGKPMALLLIHANATVTVCHSKTRNLPEVVRRGDIVVAAIGRAAMVTPEFVQPGATVIDVGPDRRYRSGGSATHLCQFSGSSREIPRKGIDSRGRRSSGCGQCCGGLHAGAWRRWPADDCDAHEQHSESSATASRFARACRRRRATLMLRIGLTGGIASGKSTVASILRDKRLPGSRAGSAGPRNAGDRPAGI